MSAAARQRSIDLGTFVTAYARRWRLVAALFVLCIAAAIPYLWLATPLYRSQTTLQYQALSTQGEGLGSTLGIGLALAGLQSDRTAPERAKAFGVLKSRAFLLPFIEKMGLAPVLIPEDYDAAAKQWRKPPSPERLHQRFIDRVMSIDDSTSTGLVTVSIFLPQSEQAQVVANQLVADLNTTLRQDAVAQAQQNIDYLTRQITSSQVAELRQGTAQLIQAEMRRLLLASGRATYAFTVVDPAVTTEKPYAPRPVLVIALALLAGLVLGIIAVAFTLVSAKDAD